MAPMVLGPFDSVSRYQALLGVSAALAHHRTIADLVHVLADQLHAVVPFEYLALVLHDAATDEMQLHVLEPASAPKPPLVRNPVSAGGPAGKVWQTQTAAVIPIVDGELLPPALEYVRSLGATVSCWLPLTTSHARIGVLAFASSCATDYARDAVAFMEQVAANVAVAVDNAINFDEARRLERALRDERDRLHLLLQINNLLVSHFDDESLLKATSEALRNAIAHEYLSAAIYDERARGLRVELAFDEARGVTGHDVIWPIDRSPAGAAFERRAAAVFSRGEMRAFGPEGTEALGPELERLCCVPLVTRHGVIGTLNVGSTHPGAFSEEEVALLAQASVQIAIAVENQIAYRSMAKRHDHLLEEKEYLEDEIRHTRELDEIVGSSPALTDVLVAVKTVAPTDATVLLLGETGTGKELVARAIHKLSPRHTRTFVCLSGAAMPAGLVESELFGYEKGAFTGASGSKMGRLEIADGGTLFLDEVGDLPPELQPKLLRVLQEREFERLGSHKTRRVDVRVIAATNRDLEQMVEGGSFRSDLFYRLNVFPIRIPPLRDRSDDIPALVRYFTERHARRMRRPVPAISPHAMHALCSYHWPGNIRELENFIERAVILSKGPTLQVSDQDLQPRARTPRHSRPMTLRDVERDSIVRALRDSGGVVGGPAGAAARLGLKRTTLQSMMRKLGIRRPAY
jgi:formate hydrogenlyase transcriptional activator